MKAQELLNKHGICTECGEMYSHHIHSPFASCKCGTSEWYKLTPYMELQKQLNESKRELKLFQLSPTYRSMLDSMLAEDTIDYVAIDSMSLSSLIEAIHEYTLK